MPQHTYRVFLRPDAWHVVKVDELSEEILFDSRREALAWIAEQDPAAVEDPDADAEQPRHWRRAGPVGDVPPAGDVAIRSAD